MAGTPTTDDIACPLVTHDMSGKAVTGMTNAADLDAVEAGATVTPVSDTGYTCTGSLVLDMAGTPTTDTIACPADPCDASSAPAEYTFDTCTGNVSSGDTCEITAKTGYESCTTPIACTP